MNLSEHRNHHQPSWEYKVPTPRGVMSRQAALYAQGLFESYRECHPMPVGDFDLSAAEERFMARYAPADIRYAMRWWERHGPPILVNRLRHRDNQIVMLNDIIRPETIERMTWSTSTWPRH